MSTFFATVRSKEWVDTKLSVLLSIYLAYSEHTNLYSIVLVWVFLAMTLSLGYVLNNIADWKADEIKYVNQSRLGRNWLIGLAVTFIVGSLILSFALGGSVAIGIAIGCLIFGAAYSLKPIRLKERGIVGVVSGAIGQRALPILPLLPALNTSASTYVLLAAVLLVGIRAMVLHQVKDYANDLFTDTQTFVTAQGVDNAITIVQQLIIPAEIVLWAMWIAMQQDMLLLAAFGITILLQLKSRKGISDTTFKVSIFYYWVIPMYASIGADMAYDWKIALICIVLIQQRKYLKALLPRLKKR